MKIFYTNKKLITVVTLRTTFACHGLPESIVLDNSPQFASSFLIKWHISCMSSTLPSSNGLAK